MCRPQLPSSFREALVVESANIAISLLFPRGISNAMHFAWCLVMTLGFSVEGARPAARLFNRCCCTKWERKTPQQTAKHKEDCISYKRQRMDRPFWFHGNRPHADSYDYCCWTTAVMCNDFGGDFAGVGMSDIRCPVWMGS